MIGTTRPPSFRAPHLAMAVDLNRALSPRTLPMLVVGDERAPTDE